MVRIWVSSEKKKSDPHVKMNIYICKKIDQVEQEIVEKLDRSASNKLDRPTSEMPGMHQPSAFSTKILGVYSLYILGLGLVGNDAVKHASHCVN